MIKKMYIFVLEGSSSIQMMIVCLSIAMLLSKSNQTEMNAMWSGKILWIYDI